MSATLVPSASGTYRVLQNLGSFETHALPIVAVVGTAEVTGDHTLCGIAPFAKPHWNARWVLRGVVALGYARSGIGCDFCRQKIARALEAATAAGQAVTA